MLEITDHFKLNSAIIQLYLNRSLGMNSIPEWAWKVLQLFIIPVALWAIATHINLKSQELKISSLEKQSVNAEKALDGHEKDIYATKKDIEILKVRMEYVASGIDDIKKMLQEQK